MTFETYGEKRYFENVVRVDVWLHKKISKYTHTMVSLGTYYIWKSQTIYMRSGDGEECFGTP